jgi:hypothetical protein
MFNCKKYFFIVCSGLLWIFSTNVIWAVESYLRDSTHRGVIDLSPYQIFPENRIGNGIYLEKRLLDSHSQRVILKIVNIKSTESHVYLFRDQNGALGLNIVKAEQIETHVFGRLTRNFTSIQTTLPDLKEFLEYFRMIFNPYYLTYGPDPE